MSDLRTKFYETIAPVLAKELGLDNLQAVPRVKKIIVNVGVSKKENPKEIDVVASEVAAITGQKPKITSAKKSIAGFNIREGDPIGVAVTLRGEKMFDFLEKLCRIVLPQVKDFRGVSSGAFDGSGNYTLGLTEQIIFPEIDYAKVERVHGLEITIVTTTNSDSAARALLVALGMPFEKNEETGS